MKFCFELNKSLIKLLFKKEIIHNSVKKMLKYSNSRPKNSSYSKKRDKKTHLENQIAKIKHKHFKK